MKCRHGLLGKCAQCAAAGVRAELLLELARLVGRLADDGGLDNSRLEELVRRLR